MIATVLAQPDANASARIAKWRQLVDLVAQRREQAPSGQVRAALEWLRSHRGDIGPRERRDVARSLAGRDVSPLLLQFFGEDDPAVAGALIGTAHLLADEWLALLPGMSPTARALLRHRRDLPPDVVKALAAFGASDFVLSGTVGEAQTQAGPEQVSGPEEGGEAQIRELVARIEAFQQTRRTGEGVDTEVLPAVEAFRWETGPNGVIVWVEGAPRGPLIGQTIARIAGGGAFGVDGQAAGAFEKKAPFRDARFRIAGVGTVGGDWRISGVPFFDQAQGGFLGYRGTARRPRLDEVAHAQSEEREDAGLFGTGVPADSLRQLIHELRTPLNAIVGFAEMIDGQYMGPAASHYRSRAKEIMEQASRLLSAVDDLDTAARIETRRLVLDQSSVDAGALLCRLHEAYEKVATQRKARITVKLAANLPPASIEAAAAERMFNRLLAATIGLASERETIRATMAPGEFGEREMICLAIDRPKAIAGLDEAALLDPGYSPDGDWPAAPALGLGFALRLVRNLAEASGGGLVIGARRFFLYLPIAGAAGRSSGQGG